MKLEVLCVLSGPESAQIHEASLGVLETADVKVGSAPLLPLLAERHLPVGAERAIIRFPRTSRVLRPVAHRPLPFRRDEGDRHVFVYWGPKSG